MPNENGGNQLKHSGSPKVTAYDAEAGEILDTASDMFDAGLAILAESYAERRGDTVVRVQDVQQALGQLIAAFRQSAKTTNSDDHRIASETMINRLQMLLNECDRRELTSTPNG
ncbi:MAG: hypothetical protein DWQ45_23105 [Planctomycetota bacterium]|nr:MAG: hypothetical protein DWQ41_25255 [Planctomycetota bacterium]REK29263.1 MAG: hypothetical protein DWQ45_23105 [Planctomycetota bacterium]